MCKCSWLCNQYFWNIFFMHMDRQRINVDYLASNGVSYHTLNLKLYVGFFPKHPVIRLVNKLLGLLRDSSPNFQIARLVNNHCTKQATGPTVSFTEE